MLLRIAGVTLILATGLTPVQAANPVGEKLVQKTIPVADLVVPIEDSPSANLVKAAKQNGIENSETLPFVLMDLIKKTVCPDSWRERGGQGSMDYFPLGLSLVIDQTPAIHQQIAELLAALRRQKDVEVGVEVRFITVPKSFCERIAVGFAEMAFLTDIQLFELMEQCQGDRRTEIMQSPKVTVFNGQEATLRILDDHQSAASQPVGLKMSIRPVVSADRQTIFMKMKVDLSRRESETPENSTPKIARVSLDKALSIPVGKTALLGGWKSTDPTNAPPILSKVPSIQRLFKNVATTPEPHFILVLVTPHLHRETEEVTTAAGAEEQEEPAARPSDVDRLLKEYRQACSDGKMGKARKLARKALAIDPACFHQRP